VNKSDAKTPRTPKALRAKFSHAVDSVSRQLLECARVPASLFGFFCQEFNRTGDAALVG